MNSRLDSKVLAVLIGAIVLAGTAGRASAQAALDDEENGTNPASPSEPQTLGIADDGKTHIGVGLRFRDAIVPRSLIELFVNRAAGGSSELGTGIELIRRKGNFEVQFAVERDPIYIVPGYWIDKGNMIPQDEPDHVFFSTDGGYFKQFGWYTAEISFITHTDITKWFSVRYGGGAGIGFITGNVNRTDAMCDTSDINSCHDSTNPADTNVHTPYDLPPVMLVVNALVGVQLRPIDNVFINVEAGIHTMPFFGTSLGYYF